MRLQVPLRLGVLSGDPTDRSKLHYHQSGSRLCFIDKPGRRPAKADRGEKPVGTAVQATHRGTRTCGLVGSRST